MFPLTDTSVPPFQGGPAIQHLPSRTGTARHTRRRDFFIP
jgi:hypothetical protein